MNVLSRLLRSVSNDTPLIERSPLQQVENRLTTLGQDLVVLTPEWQAETEGPKTVVKTNVPLMDGMDQLSGMLAITIEPTKISLNNLAGTSRDLSIDQDPVIRIPANNKAVDAVMKSFEGDARKADLVAGRALRAKNKHRSEGSAFNIRQL